VIYNVTGIINFAQGEFAMLGAMLANTLVEADIPLPLASLVSVASVTLVGALLERAAIHPARRATTVTLIIITIGLDITIRGIALLAWGTTPHRLPVFTQGPPLDILGAVLSRQRAWIMASTALILIGLYFFFARTLVGKALRACAVNRLAARFMGISPDRMSLVAFSLSAGLGAMAGIVIAPLSLVSYDVGLGWGLRGFVAAVMGGFVDPVGAVVGGLLIGVLESLSAGLLTSSMKNAVAFLVLFLILFFRPHGIFSARRAAQAGL
jgi:branched-chain amino acid transport system permease protein